MSDKNEKKTAEVVQETKTTEESTPMTETQSTEQNSSPSAFSLEIKDNGIAMLCMDVPGESMNTLKAEFGEQISAVLKDLKANTKVTGLILYSGKKDSFVAGADVTMLDACNSADEAVTLSRQGHMVFDQLERLPFPVVAAIHGPCLGGGLELAMACHMRVCSDDGKTALGLPEVQLGLLPGGGGTQRLPKLAGIQKALDMMLTGKQLRGKQALKAGIVDDVVPNSVLLDVAEKMALAGKKTKKRKMSLMDKLLEGNSFGRRIVFDQATKTVLKKTKGNYPSPLKIIDCIRTGVERGNAQGYQVEANHFGELVMSPESAQLRNIFFATTEMKKEQGVAGVEPQKIDHIGVLGGGLMGGGIAFVSATKAGVTVRLKDIAPQGIVNALKYSYDLLNKKVKRRFMRKTEMQSQMAQITGTLDYSGFKYADMVIEAVFEDLSLKQKMVEEIEQNTKESTIFASNTSSLPINQIAANAKRPENVIGLHYFSPVDKMPLAEIIAFDKTSEQTISTTVAFARKQGKTPIVVKDEAGFYVNRILAPYVNEAANLILEGEPIDKIDKALVKFGFPVGPVMLLDEVGIDVGTKISPILEKELGERFKAPKAFDKIIQDGRKGKKSGKGFYDYSSKKKQVDESIYSLLDVTPSSSLSDTEIAERCLYTMLNEAVRCLDENIIRNARDGDIGAIFGIGFPPFLGGPFRYIDTIGAVNVVNKLNAWAARHGERYKPCQALIDMAEQGNTCY